MLQNQNKSHQININQEVQDKVGAFKYRGVYIYHVKMVLSTVKLGKDQCSKGENWNVWKCY